MYQTQVVPQEIEGRVWPFHLALEDASGDAAIIEFVGGQMNVYHGPEFNTLTNDPPLPQMPDLTDYQYFGGSLPLPGDNNPTSRFVRASAFLSSLNFAFSNQALKPTPVSAMFTAIRAITEPFGSVQYLGPGAVPGPTPVAAWPTTWTIVSDLTNQAVYFFHNLVLNNFWIDMKKLNFQPGAPVRFLNRRDRIWLEKCRDCFPPHQMGLFHCSCFRIECLSVNNTNLNATRYYCSLPHPSAAMASPRSRARMASLSWIIFSRLGLVDR